jgi:hypothetical protein
MSRQLDRSILTTVTSVTSGAVSGVVVLAVLGLARGLFTSVFGIAVALGISGVLAVAVGQRVYMSMKAK